MNRLTIIFLCVTVGLVSGILGFGIGSASAPRPQPSAFQQALAQLQDGETLEVEISEDAVVDYERREGGSVDAEDSRFYARVLSWFGLGATEAAAQFQGIKEEDGTLTIGKSEGYGVLEKLWSRIKSLFWFMTFGLGILLVLCFVPVVGPIARTIFRALAAVVPVIGSIVERIIGGLRTKQKEKELTQVVQGGEKFKQSVAAREDIPPEAKVAVKAEFTAAHSSAQDEATKAAVAGVRLA